MTEIQERLFALQDPLKTRDFTAPLIPNVARETHPRRAHARPAKAGEGAARQGKAEDLPAASPTIPFEENGLHAFSA